MDHPDRAILRCRDARHLAQDPVVGQWLGPGGVHRMAWAAAASCYAFTLPAFTRGMAGGSATLAEQELTLLPL